MHTEGENDVRGKVKAYKLRDAPDEHAQELVDFEPLHALHGTKPRGCAKQLLPVLCGWRLPTYTGCTLSPSASGMPAVTKMH